MVGLAVSDEATLGVVDMVRHPLTHIMHAIGSLTIGSLIFGIATFRADVLPAGAPLAATGPIWLFTTIMTGLNESLLPVVVPLVELVAITALSWIWLRYGLIVQRRTVVAECSPKFVASWAAGALGGPAIPRGSAD